MDAETYANETAAFVNRTLNGSSPNAFPEDPYLQFQPAFSLSFPIQILMTSLTATLVIVLLIQMVFTAQYHWPLAKLNFTFQLLGVCTLCISLVAELSLVLHQAYKRSREWPYMLPYIASPIPPLDDDSDSTILPWTQAQKLAWYIMEAAVSGLVHIANIQYLTLLYPSTFERWLIFILLVPLAVISAGMEIAAISTQYGKTADLLRNICNCTLSLLFTIALCVWGFIINARSAWRTDGGTAIFGAGAILLAGASSALNIIIIPEKDQLFWLQPLVWSVVLWQSFLGWWWWVGCAVESNNIEDMLLRERKRALRRSRIRSKKAAKAAAAAEGGQTSSFKSGVHRVVGGLRLRANANVPASSVASVPLPDRLESIEMSDMGSQRSAALPMSRTSSGAASTSSPLWQRLWRALRREHENATFVQALELTAESAEARRGWGLGHFAVRQRDEATRIVDELHSGGELHELVDAPPRATQRPPERSSFFWWGPLERWRLRDRTVY